MSISHEENGIKLFLPDPSVALSDHSFWSKFGRHTIAMPMRAIERIEEARSSHRDPSIRLIAERALSEMGQFYGRTWNGDPSIMRLATGGKFRLLFNQWQNVPLDDCGDERIGDIILRCAKYLKGEYPNTEVIVVSKNKPLWFKGLACGITVEDYKSGLAFQSIAEIPTGLKEYRLEYNLSFIAEKDQPSNCGGVTLCRLSGDGLPTPPDHVNQCLKIYTPAHSQRPCLAIYKGDDLYLLVKRDYQWSSRFVINPKNDEQALALGLMHDPTIPIVCIIGPAGSGKTHVALGSALSIHGSATVCRRPQEIGETLGALPGGVSEKMDPYARPIYTLLRRLIGLSKDQRDWSEAVREVKPMGDNGSQDDPVARMFSYGAVRVIPPNYILGDNLEGWIVSDEAQNLLDTEVLAIATRLCGNDAKAVFVGDYQQIYRPYVTAGSAGMSHLIKSMHGDPMFGLITLPKSVRNPLVERVLEKW